MENMIFQWVNGMSFDNQKYDYKINYINKRIDQKLNKNCPRRMRIQLGYMTREEYSSIFSGNNFGDYTYKTRNFYNAYQNKLVSIHCHRFRSTHKCVFVRSRKDTHRKDFFERGFSLKEEIVYEIERLYFKFFEDYETLDLAITVRKERTSSTSYISESD